MRVDIAVVGAGPAGIAAALAAAAQGANVVVIDEDLQPGGRMQGQLHQEPESGRWWVGRRAASEMVQKAKETGVTFLSSASVWGLTPGWQVHVDAGPGRPALCEAKSVILATGAAEQGISIPGWTLPGVMTPGAAQVLVNVHGVKPGNRALVVGFDVLGMVVADLLKLAGVEVVGICGWPSRALTASQQTPAAAIRRLSLLASKAAPSPALRMLGRLGSQPWAAAAGARLMPDELKVLGLPLWLRQVAVELRGNGQVEEAVLAPVDQDGQLVDGPRKTVKVDLVCLAGGLHPLAELAVAAGCQTTVEPALGGQVVLHGPSQETTAPGLFVAGNITGVEGAKVCMAQGRLAGLGAAAYIGRKKAPPAEFEAARKDIKRARETALVTFRSGIAAAREQLERRWQAL